MLARQSYLQAVRLAMTWRRPALLTSAAVLGLFAAGCGNQYRPVVSAINTVGPALQATKYAIAISNPSATSPGLLTFVDFAGDTVLTTPQILSNPSYLALAPGGGTGFAINTAGSFNEFQASSPTSLLSSDVSQSTLTAGAAPTSISSFTVTGSNASVFVPEPGVSQVAALSSANGSLVQNIGVANNPIYVVGASSARRAYAISAGDGVTPSTVTPIESGNLATSTPIPVGINPTYGVMTSDGNRAFILNRGSGTVSVINVINNGLDNDSTLGANSTIAVGTNPVWADLASSVTELVVLNQGDGVHPGTLSIIDIPLCNSTTVINPNSGCDTTNPVDATNFGTVHPPITVGINPVMVSVLQDNNDPKAYVANQGVICATGVSNCTNVEGSVSVVDLISGTVTATIPATSLASATTDTNTTPTEVYGHPTTIAATSGDPTGKVYITSSDNKFLSVIETDTDTVLTHVNLQGLGVRVVVTAQ